MDLHTWIFITAILVYLYFITRVYDGYKILFIQKIKIHLPNPDKTADEDRWKTDVKAINKKINRYKIQQVSLFLLIPILEIALHFWVGDYEINSQLLTLIFFVLFITTLLLVLILYKGRKINQFQKKYSVKRQTML